MIEDDVQELVFCGGTADYIRSEVDTYFQKQDIPVSWHANIPIPDIASSLGNRMADVVALHEHMVLEFDRATGHERSQPLFGTPTAKPAGVADIKMNANTLVKRVPNYTPREVPKEFLTMSDKSDKA